MKKLLLALTFVISIIIFSSLAFAKETNKLKIFVNGKELKTESKIINGNTMIPIKDMFNAAGIKYKLVAKYKSIVGTRGDKVVTVGISKGYGSGVIYGLPLDGKIDELNSYRNEAFDAKNLKGRMYVPLKKLAQLMEDTVKYDANKKIIYITTKKENKGNIDIETFIREIDKKIQEYEYKSKLQADLSVANMIIAKVIQYAILEKKIEYPESEISVVVKAKSNSLTLNGYDFTKYRNLMESVPDINGFETKNKGWNITLNKKGEITIEVLDDIKNPKKIVKLYPIPEKFSEYPYSLLNESQSQNNTESTNLTDLSKEKTERLTIKTSKGDIEIALYTELMPITVENFQSLVKQNFYKGLAFHRVEDWVIQGGDPKGDGTGGSSKTIKLETNNKLKNLRGAIAMARASDPDSASSQFYILKTDATWLDGQYAVFGRVLSGMEIVDKIEVGDKITNIEKVSMHNDK